jgi:iron complex outermembrane receptor protein
MKSGGGAGAVAITVATQLLLASAAHAASDQLLELSIEELSNLEITSVSRHAERLSDAPTSVFVITSDDLRRSGATNLADALRLAPNLQVARVSATEFTVSARGFNGTAANKMLVLIDGRSVYSPLFSGVFWDVQSVMLEDVERIEVISGPGGTLWGVNAVNGVINVITKSAAQTQGTVAVAEAGSMEDHARLRLGGTSGAGASYRAYVSVDNYRHTQLQSGEPVDDAAKRAQLGFRSDWSRDADSYMLKGDAYVGRADQPQPGSISFTNESFALGSIRTSGGNLTGRWQRSYSADSSISVQAYLDHTERTVVPTIDDRQDIFSLQLQQALSPWEGNKLVWGAEYRVGRDQFTNSIYASFLPGQLTDTMLSAFAQDEVTLSQNLQLTLGLRAERNGYTGLEWLPNLRLAWKPASDQLLWAAASRAVRAPSRIDHDLYVPYQAGGTSYLLRGGPDVASETDHDYELGYRGQLGPAISISGTLYRASYAHLRTQQIDPSRTYLTFASDMKGVLSGFEGWGSYQLTRDWRVSAGYNHLHQNLRVLPVSNDTTSVAAYEGANPNHWWSMRSSLDLNARTQLDLTFRRVGALALPTVPAYSALDLRLGWQLRHDTDLSVIGQDLLDGRHGEFTSITTRSALGPVFLVRLTWRP